MQAVDLCQVLNTLTMMSRTQIFNNMDLHAIGGTVNANKHCRVKFNLDISLKGGTHEYNIAYTKFTSTGLYMEDIFHCLIYLQKLSAY